MKNRLSLLLATFFVGMSFGLVFPVLSPLLMDETLGFFEGELSNASRGMILGCIAASFALGQTLGSPFLGSLSDKIGRKKALMLAISMASVGFILAFISIEIGAAWGLALARWFLGVASNSYVVAQAAVIDYESEDSKSTIKEYGLLAMAWGIGFIVGPYLSGQAVTLLGWSYPFLMGFIFSLALLGFIYFQYQEKMEPQKERKLSFTQGIKSIKGAFQITTVRSALIVIFLFSLGNNFFNEFFSVHLKQNFSFTPSSLGSFWTLLGISLAISQGLLIRPFIERFSTEKILTPTLLLLGASFMSLLFAETGMHFYLIIPFIAFFQAFIIPCASAMVASSFPKGHQGEILGISGAMQTVSMIVLPLAAGSFVALYPILPAILAALAMTVAALSYRFNSTRKKDLTIK